MSSLPPPVPPADAVQRRWVLALVSLASFMLALDAMVLSTALAPIRADFGASIESLQWAVNAFNLSFAVLLLTGAALGERFGRRRVLVLGLGLFVAASAACASAGSMAWLIAARAAQGAGAALAMPVAMSLLSATFGREDRARALGIFGSITGLALIVGPALGGAVTQGLAWPWIFWINLPIGMAVMALLRRHVAESRGPAASLDLAGALLAAGASLGLVWALVRGHAAGWRSLETGLALAAGLLLALGFVAWQRRAAAPMLPLRLFRAPGFSAGIAASFFFYAPMYGTLFMLPQYLQAQGASPLAAGLRLLPWTATLFVVAPLAGRLVPRMGERTLVLAGVLLQAAGAVWVALVVGADLPYGQLMLPLALYGAGVSMAMPAAQNAVLGAVAPADIGKASGAFNMFRYLGGMFGIALSVEVFARSAGSSGAASGFGPGFAACMSAAALLCLAAAAAATRLPGRRHSTLNQAASAAKGAKS